VKDRAQLGEAARRRRGGGLRSVPSKLEAGSKAGSKRAAGVGGAVGGTNLWSESAWAAGWAVAQRGQL